MSKCEILKEIKRDLSQNANYISFKYETVKEIYELLTKQEFVRCQDCEHWRKLVINMDGHGACRADNQVNVSAPDWFCADGVRNTKTE